MKKIIIKSIVVLLCMSGLSCGKNVAVTVIDEEGKPIEEAEVIAWSIGSNKSKDQKFEGKTNDRGVVSLGVRDDARRLHIYIEKVGYYKNIYKHSYGTAVFVGKKEKLRVNSILKKRVDPIPLFVRDYKILVPVKSKKIGFDFEVGDFVAPHGKGKITDVFFEVNSERKDVFNYVYQLDVSFPRKKDGIQHFLFSRDDLLSELKSPHLAPKTGYKATFQRTSSSKGRDSKTNSVRLRNHWMRVRTKTDEDGHITSANYVKIYGDFPEMVYYFNPTPNDRNLEFDPARNLSKNLKNKHRKLAP